MNVDKILNFHNQKKSLSSSKINNIHRATHNTPTSHTYRPNLSSSFSSSSAFNSPHIQDNFNEISLALDAFNKYYLSNNVKGLKIVIKYIANNESLFSHEQLKKINKALQVEVKDKVLKPSDISCFTASHNSMMVTTNPSSSEQKITHKAIVHLKRNYKKYSFDRWRKVVSYIHYHRDAITSHQYRVLIYYLNLAVNSKTLPNFDYKVALGVRPTYMNIYY